MSLRTLATGIVFGESPRWGPDGRLWLADWGTREIVAVGLDGRSEVMAELGFPSFQAICLDWLPDGRLLIVSAREGKVVRRERDGSLVTHADLSTAGRPLWNEIVVDGRGNAYLNNSGFDLPGGEEFTPGSIALLMPDGSARQVAEGVAFPNGMAVTPDNSTLICAESYAKRLTAFDIAPNGGLSDQRVWAELGDGVPDGICLDAEGAVWYGDVPNRRCVRVREGGEVLDTIDLELGCFACMLGGSHYTTLFMVVREWRGPASMADQSRTGQVLVAEAPAPGAGWP
jgi:sugar lactone lactonase YvrE